MQPRTRPAALIAFWLGLFACLGGASMVVVHAKRSAARRIATELEVPSIDEPRTRVCAAGRVAAPVVELVADDIDVVAVPYGPRVARQPLPSAPLNRSEVARNLAELGPSLTPCYRSARQRHPALEGTLNGLVKIDSWGRIREVAFADDSSEVARCIAQALQDRELAPGYRPRVTSVQFSLRLERSGLGTPHDVVVPAAKAIDEPTACVLQPASLSIDVWTSSQPVVVSDYDEKQACEEQHGRCSALAPDVVPGFATLGRAVLVRAMTRRFDDNLGAYRACALAAPRSFDRDVRRFAVSFDVTGVVREVTQARGQDDETRACLAAALAEVWGPAWSAPYRIEVRLVLRRGADRRVVPATAPIAEVEDLAAAALAEGDGARAARHLAALLREAPDDTHACAWQAEQLAALQLESPWGDPRFEAALIQLARRLDPHRDSSRTCSAIATPAINSWLAGDEDGERHRRVLALIPDIANHRALAYRRAELLAGLTRDAERPMADDPPCAAGEAYLAIAEQECVAGGVDCAPAFLAERTLERCAQRRRFIRHVCHGFPSSVPFDPPTERLQIARRFLLEHSAPSRDRDRMLRHWAWDLADDWGHLDDASRVLREILAHGTQPELLVDASDELLRIATHLPHAAD